MFLRSTRLNNVLSVLFVVSMGACGNFGSCAACGSTAALPEGGTGDVPGNQTIEGGAQIRVTPAGFTKLTSILPSVLSSTLGAGQCIAEGQIGTYDPPDLNPFSFNAGSTGVRYCHETNAGCTGNACKLDLGVNSTSLSVTANNTILVSASISASTSVLLEGSVTLVGSTSCTLTASSSGINVAVELTPSIQAANGELALSANVDSINLNLDFTGGGVCGVVAFIGNLISNLTDDLENSFAGPLVNDLLQPEFNALIQSILPNPLGINSITDIGSLLDGVSPDTVAHLETRIVPGGYADLNGGGLSLGVITGLNSDVDRTTRTGMRPDGVPYVSEPALCVPPLPITDYSMPPFSLPTVARTALANDAAAFQLNAAGAFNGSPDPSADIAMGISQTTLDLAGHHLVTSGAMCLGVGTSLISQLNVGTIAILVPSLGDLESAQGNDPLLLVTRPQRAITFTVGDNTMMSPALNISLSHMEVDFYAFLYERYVRAFTLDLTMNIGVNLAFEQPMNGAATITPSLVGISAADVTLSVLNSEFVKETPEHLEMVLPSVFDLVTPLLGNLPAIQVPTFAGFSLNDLSIQKVTTSQDNFLALFATLGSSVMARTLAAHDRSAAETVAQMDAQIRPIQPQSTGRATLHGVNTPTPEVIRGALLGATGGALPTVTFDVDRTDSLGRELEWTWNFNGGLFREYTTPTGPLVISDRAFAWQGKFDIGLKSRVKGDYHTVSDVITTKVVIDSVGPKILSNLMTWNGDALTVPVWDVVSVQDVQVAFGSPGQKPATDWVYQGDATLSRSAAEGLAVNGEIAVFARDEVGNVTIGFVNPFHGDPTGTAGCTCDSSGRPSAGGLLLIGIVGFVVVRRRRRRFNPRMLRVIATFGLWAGASVAMSLQPGCSCSKKGSACETTADCTECPQGQLPFCIDNTCVCSTDIPIGHLGPYSNIAAGPDGTMWVSAYHETYGDLVVAQATGGRIPDTSWEWVDGVPTGPVVVPGSMIRGGISDNGPNVGMYTSIKVEPDGTPVVTYFDVDRGALKFAARVAGVWQISDVDVGTGSIDNVGGSVVGMYSSLTLRGDNGYPGVAYLAHVTDSAGQHAEVRYASAQTLLPASPSDWQTWTVDTGIVPPDDPNNPNIYPLPEGLGLFIDSARNPTNQAPVVTYYDRGSFDLKLTKFDPTTGQFGTPVVLDGSNGTDAGWSPSVQVDATGKAHVAYCSATSNLKYVVEGSMPEVIDDGYRIVGQTVDGLPKPTFDFVGDDAGLVLPSADGPMVVYQDSTTQELLLATRQPAGIWSHVSIAGATSPWPGAYGFFASAALRTADVAMSNWVIDEPTGDNWVEVFTTATAIQ